MKKMSKYLLLITLAIALLAYLFFYAYTVSTLSDFKIQINSKTTKSKVTSIIKHSKEEQKDNLNQHSPRSKNKKLKEKHQVDVDEVDRVVTTLVNVHSIEKELKKALDIRELTTFCVNICRNSNYKEDYQKIRDNAELEYLIDFESNAFEDPIFLEKALGIRLLSIMLPKSFIKAIEKAADPNVNSFTTAFKFHLSLFGLSDHFKRILSKEGKAFIKEQATLIDDYKNIHSRCQSDEILEETAIASCKKVIEKMNFSYLRL